MTVHDLAFRHHPEWFTAHGVRFFERFLKRVRVAEIPVIVPSATTAADCVDAGIDDELIHVVPWGIDASTVTAERINEIRVRHRLPETFVVFVGTLEPRKNLETLVAAMEVLPDVPLVVVGPKGWGDVSTGDAVTLSQLTDDDVAAVIAAARALVYPSRFEGFGLPVLEAMAQGTPVVVTEGTAPAALAADAGLAVATDGPDALVEAIEAIISSDATHDRLGNAGRLRSAEYTWQQAAAATAEVYERRAGR